MENTVKTAENRGGKPFTKDDPRINRNGRPKGSFSLVEMIKKKLQEVPEGKDKTYAEYFIEQLMKKSVIEGDTSMMKDMINRVDGMPKQAMDLTTNGKDLFPDAQAREAAKQAVNEYLNDITGDTTK